MSGGTNVQTSLQGGTAATGAMTTGSKVINYGKSMPWWAWVLIVSVPCGAIVAAVWFWFKNQKKG